MNRLRIVAVLLALAALLMTSDAVQRQIGFQSQRIKCLRVTVIHVLRDILKRNSPDSADRSGKVFVDHLR